MKKLLLSFLFLSIVQIGLTQTFQGNKLVGVDGNFSIRFLENADDLFFLNLNPSYGVFIKDNLALGGTFGLNYSKSNVFSTTGFSLLPFARIYFAEPDAFQFFVEGSLGLYLEGISNDFGSNNETALRYQFGPGAAFFLNEKVSFDVQLLVDRIGGNFDISRLGLFFGFQFYLGENEKD